MTNDKKHAPDSLKYQWRLLGSVQRAKWATSLDKSIAYEIIDNYRKDRGNSRASLRYLEKATGARRPNVIASLRRLVEKGPISIAVPGGGTRPTAYNLDFNSVAEKPSGNAGDTASDSDPSGIADDTSVVSQAIPLDGASGNAGDTESVLQVVGLQADLLDRMNDPAAPTAPPLAGGLTAPAAGGTAVDELQHSPAKPTFEALWLAYDYARGKREARAAWNALPAEVDRTKVIEAAKAWQASWAAQGKPDAPRFTLARWLRDERYDEDAPRGFRKVERGKAKPESNALNPARKTRATRIVARITASEIVKVGAGVEMHFTATDASGAETSHVIVLEHDDEQIQIRGQKRLAALVNAAGLMDVIDTSELHGRAIVIYGEEFAAPAERPADEPPPPERHWAHDAAPPAVVEPLPAPQPRPDRKPLEAAPAAIQPRALRPAPRLDEPPEPRVVDFETWRRHAGLTVEEAEAEMLDEDDEAA